MSNVIPLTEMGLLMQQSMRRKSRAERAVRYVPLTAEDWNLIKQANPPDSEEMWKQPIPRMVKGRIHVLIPTVHPSEGTEFRVEWEKVVVLKSKENPAKLQNLLNLVEGNRMFIESIRNQMLENHSLAMNVQLLKPTYSPT